MPPGGTRSPALLNEKLRQMKPAGRILTTHCGSLPRPHSLLDMMKAKLSGGHYDHGAYEGLVRGAVRDSVRKQIECGIDIPTDGEMSKPGFFAYVRERLDGFEPQPGFQFPRFAAEMEAFPEYYATYMQQAMLGGAVAKIAPLVCVGPVSYRTLE